MMQNLCLNGVWYAKKENGGRLPFMAPGEVVDIIEEKHNIYDPNALSVRYESVHVGYVPAKITHRIKARTATIVRVDMSQRPPVVVVQVEMEEA